MPSADREVQLWRADLDVSPAQLRRLIGYLSAEELTRAARLRRERDRRRWTAARGWLRRLLGAELGVPAATVALRVAASGKPSVPGLCFSLSHSGTLALIAVSHEHEVGVDVEAVTADRPVPERFLCAAERTAVDGAADRSRAALQCWVGKEAYVKGTGEGIDDRIRELDMSPLVASRPATLPDGWSVWPIEVGPGYMGALAVGWRGSGDIRPPRVRPVSSHPRLAGATRRATVARAVGGV
ncbi:MAG: 4'-phosphopantetheinyl transferase superfamily protein [Solirubrobacterales bacterium]|nr:4'-phosphopantetheinyl transferase superfamily protein [Solirubrobacterales bacterium]